MSILSAMESAHDVNIFNFQSNKLQMPRASLDRCSLEQRLTEPTIIVEPFIRSEICITGRFDIISSRHLVSNLALRGEPLVHSANETASLNVFEVYQALSSLPWERFWLDKKVSDPYQSFMDALCEGWLRKEHVRSPLSRGETKLAETIQPATNWIE